MLLFFYFRNDWRHNIENNNNRNSDSIYCKEEFDDDNASSSGPILQLIGVGAFSEYQNKDGESVLGTEPVVKRRTSRLGRTFFFRNRSPSLQGALTLNAKAAMSTVAAPTHTMTSNGGVDAER